MIKYIESEKELEDTIKEGLYLVDFYADWCGPCRMLGEVLEELDGINVLKINTDQFTDLALKYGVMSIPAIFLIKDGEVVKNSIGYKTLDEIKEFIKI